MSTLNKDIVDVRLCYENMKKLLPVQIAKSRDSLSKYNDLHCSAGSVAMAKDSNQGIIKIVILMPIYNGIKETLEAINSFKNYFNNVNSI